MNFREYFHSISLKRRGYFDPVLEQYGLTMLQLEILVSLHEEPNSNTFTDIMKAKDYAKSHISTAINHLVEEGYIVRKPSATNKKVYYLYLLEKSHPLVTAYGDCIQRFQADAFAGITEEELALYEKILIKMRHNLTKE